LSNNPSHTDVDTTQNDNNISFFKPIVATPVAYLNNETNISQHTDKLINITNKLTNNVTNLEATKQSTKQAMQQINDQPVEHATEWAATRPDKVHSTPYTR
jgi:hypothetical protein